MSYAFVNNGTVVTTAEALPTSFNGVSGFNLLTAEQQQQMGWWAVTPPDQPTYDPDTQMLGAIGYRVTASGVSSYFDVADVVATALSSRLSSAKTQVAGQVDGIVNTKCNAGFTFGGKAYQSDPVAVQRMQAAATAALAAILAGHGAANNLRWANPNTDFQWIASDNSLNPMDAPTMLQFFSTAISIGQAIILYGRAVKNAVAAAADFPTLRAIDVTAGWPV